MIRERIPTRSAWIASSLRRRGFGQRMRSGWSMDAPGRVPDGRSEKLVGKMIVAEMPKTDMRGGLVQKRILSNGARTGVRPYA